VPEQPQRGQGDCLREKVAHSTLGDHVQNERADETFEFAAKKTWSSSSLFVSDYLSGTQSVMVFAKKGTALTALGPHCHRKRTRCDSANSAK